jgi:hypothetical protein
MPAAATKDRPLEREPALLPAGRKRESQAKDGAGNQDEDSRVRRIIVEAGTAVMGGRLGLYFPGGLTAQS